MYDELNQKLGLLQYLLRKLKMRGRMEGGLMSDTTSGQGRILALLKMRDGITAKDLSFLLGLAASSMSELLSKLEKNGYIVREQSESDKRVTIIRLTEKGKQEEQTELFDPENIFACLNEKEQKAFGDYLDRIIESLKTKLGYDDEEANARMNEANRQMEELMKHFHGAHGHSHHSLQKHMEWHKKNGFPFGERFPKDLGEDDE